MDVTFADVNTKTYDLFDECPVFVLSVPEPDKCTSDVVVEAHCYVVDIGRTYREQIRSRINNN